MVPQWWASYGVAAAFFALALIAMGVSILRFHQARTSEYYFMREAARRSGARWLLAALASLILGGGILYARARGVEMAIPSPTTPATATGEVRFFTPTPSPIPTDTPTPSPTPRPPTPTPSPTFTPTPFYPMPETARSPLPGAVPARPEARITLETFALGVENNQPVQPGTEFVAGDFRVYAFIRYEGMNRGATWTYGWYREGEYLDGNTCLWGVRLPDCPYISGEQGRTFLYYRRPGGYDPARYEVRIWVEDRLQGVFPFVIQPAP